MWLRIIIPVVVICDLVQGKGLTCSCQLDNVYSNKIDIHCGKTSNAASSTLDEKMVSCEKEVLGSVARGYSYVEGFGLYKLHRTAKDYASAANFCESEGASLFVPETKEEVERVMPLLKAYPKLEQVFIGINDIAEEGKFVTSQGVALTSLEFQKWLWGQPDNYGNEDCLALTNQGELNDASCSSWQAFLCERNVNGVPRGYSYEPGFGLYKLHSTAKDYASAAKSCEFEGASLFVPETKEEVQRVMPLFKDNPKLDQAFIGINDIAEEGNFVTSQGVALTSLAFQKWKSGQPDNYNNEDCLTLTKEGELNDALCSTWQAFLCERNVTGVPPGYSYEEGFGFYKLYSGEKRATFREAVRRCERDGAALAVPDTYDEAAILLRLYDQVPGVFEGWVGVSDIREEGNYVTTAGKSLTSLQFQNWGNGEPNRDNPESEDCLGLHEAGILADYSCDDQKPYTCEISFDL